MEYFEPTPPDNFVTKTVTFDGNANLGAVGNVPLFATTGEVWVVRLITFCTSDLTEALATATLVLGVTGSTTLFIGSTNAVTIDTGQFWVSTSPTGNGIALPAPMTDIVITDNIVGTVGAQAINGGVLRFDLFWRPLSSNGLVVAA